MAQVVWSAGIDSVSGALSKPSKSGQHSCNKMLLGTHRVAPTTNPNCNRIFLRKKVERTAPLTANELSARTRFTQVRAMVAARRIDLQRIVADQQAFLAQKDSPNGCKTMTKWYWRVCGDEWEAQNS